MIQIIGNLGKDPVTLPTKIGNVVKLRVLVNEGSGDNRKTTGYDVTVFDSELGKNALAELASGHAVAVEGDYSTQEFNGVTQHQIVARRIGVIQFLKRTPWDPSKGKGKATTPAPAAEETSEYDV